MFTITIESGPPPYLHTEPLRAKPVSGLFEINNFMRDLLHTRYPARTVTAEKATALWMVTPASRFSRCGIPVRRSANPLFQNNITFVALLWGGLVTDFLWCIFLNIRNRTYGDGLKP